jgi:hypothetical protein
MTSRPGARQAWTGKSTQTVTQQVVTSAAQKCKFLFEGPADWAICRDQPGDQAAALDRSATCRHEKQPVPVS